MARSSQSARYLDIHPVDPQPRLIDQAVHVLQEGGLIAYPTDSCYALGCTLDAREPLERIRRIRQVGKDHHFTLVCADFAQLSQFVIVSNPTFRLVKNSTPGPYTFILPATKEVPRRMAHPKKHTVGVRIPDHRVTHAPAGGSRGADRLLHPPSAGSGGPALGGLGGPGPAGRSARRDHRLR